MLSCFSCVQLFVTLWTVAHQARLSIGFSRQEYWSGLPFPSPVYESEKWKWSRSVMSIKPVCSRLVKNWLKTDSELNFLIDTIHRTEQLSLFSHVQLFVTLWTVACQAPLSMGFSRQEYRSGLLCSFFLQGIFPTLELNPYLLHLWHWKQVLYPLSHLGTLQVEYSKWQEDAN